MGKDSVVEFRKPGMVEDPLTELLRRGARRLIEQAIEAELAELLGRYEGQVDEGAIDHFARIYQARHPRRWPAWRRAGKTCWPTVARSTRSQPIPHQIQ